MNKTECRKFAGQPLCIRPDNGLLCAEQIQWLVSTSIKTIDHHRTLVLNVYPREQAAHGNLSPRWTMVQAKNDYITLGYKDDGKTAWRTGGL